MGNGESSGQVQAAPYYPGLLKGKRAGAAKPTPKEVTDWREKDPLLRDLAYFIEVNGVPPEDAYDLSRFLRKKITDKEFSRAMKIFENTQLASEQGKVREQQKAAQEDIRKAVAAAESRYTKIYDSEPVRKAIESKMLDLSEEESKNPESHKRVHDEVMKDALQKDKVFQGLRKKAMNAQKRVKSIKPPQKPQKERPSGGGSLAVSDYALKHMNEPLYPSVKPGYKYTLDNQEPPTDADGNPLKKGDMYANKYTGFQPRGYNPEPQDPSLEARRAEYAEAHNKDGRPKSGTKTIYATKGPWKGAKQVKFEPTGDGRYKVSIRDTGTKSKRSGMKGKYQSMSPAWKTLDKDVSREEINDVMQRDMFPGQEKKEEDDVLAYEPSSGGMPDYYSPASNEEEVLDYEPSQDTGTLEPPLQDPRQDSRWMSLPEVGSAIGRGLEWAGNYLDDTIPKGKKGTMMPEMIDEFGTKDTEAPMHGAPMAPGMHGGFANESPPEPSRFMSLSEVGESISEIASKLGITLKEAEEWLQDRGKDAIEWARDAAPKEDPFEGDWDFKKAVRGLLPPGTGRGWTPYQYEGEDPDYDYEDEDIWMSPGESYREL